MTQKTLIVLLGPTGVGKTDLCLEIAEHWNIPIINADSRQIYQGMPICTAAPTKEQQDRVKHYFVETLPITEYYSAARFETEALQVIENLHKSSNIALMSGGSMLYLDAVCNGIDDIPTVDDLTRNELKERLENEGIDRLRNELQIIDPITYQKVDLKNPRRIIHALEVYYSTGKPYSSFLRQGKKQRPFNIIKIGLHRERQELFSRINQRVDHMVKQGVYKEAEALFPYKDYNALQTVGFNELFKVIEKEWTLDFAIEKIKRNTRVYAKKQMTWFKHDDTIKWFLPEDKQQINTYLEQSL